MKKMKLYVWEGVLTDYSSGILFAMAPDLKTAVALAKGQTLGYESEWVGSKFQGAKPVRYSKSTAGNCHGGG